MTTRLNSSEFLWRRARTRQGKRKVELIRELRQLEIAFDHLCIEGACFNATTTAPDEAYLKRRAECESEMDKLVFQLTEITHST